MVTSSRIGILTSYGIVHSIYCHFDGYLENNGIILFNHYKTYDKVDALIDNGNISHLGTTISQCHTYLINDTSNKFYVMDMSIKGYVNECIAEGVKFIYLFKDNQWYFTNNSIRLDHYNDNFTFTPLQLALQVIEQGEGVY